MVYSVKELFYTLQGEGANTGHPAVFCRFSGCNLWNGVEIDRQKAICKFCDTNFVGTDGLGGGKFEARSLIEAATNLLPRQIVRNDVLFVCTGGEPLLQLDTHLICVIRDAGFKIAIETNGSLPVPPGIDWVCVSPKPNVEIIPRNGNELKFVYPQQDIHPSDYEDLKFEHWYLQPMDGPDLKENTELAIKYCLEHPRWKLSIQTHKILGMR